MLPQPQYLPTLSICVCVYLQYRSIYRIYCFYLSTVSAYFTFFYSNYLLYPSIYFTIYLRYITMSLPSYIYLLYLSHLSIFTVCTYSSHRSIYLSHTHSHTDTLTRTKRDVSPPNLSTGFVLPRSNQISSESLQPDSHYRVQRVCGVCLQHLASHSP